MKGKNWLLMALAFFVGIGIIFYFVLQAGVETTEYYRGMEMLDGMKQEADRYLSEGRAGADESMFENEAMMLFTRWDEEGVLWIVTYDKNKQRFNGYMAVEHPIRSGNVSSIPAK